VVNKFF